MENRCLVTKLKGSVNNNNLPKYNTIRMKLHIDSSVQESARSGETVLNTDNPIDVNIPEEGVFVRIGGTPVKSFTSDSIKGIVWPVGDYTIEIGNKYVVDMSGKGVDNTDKLFYVPLSSYTSQSIKLVIPTSELTFAKEFRGVEVNPNLNLVFFEGKLSNLSECKNLEYFNISNGVSGTLEDIENLIGLKSLVSMNNSIEGTTSSLGKLINLSFIRYTNCSNLKGSITSLNPLKNLNKLTLYTTGVTGSIDDMLTAWSTAGKTDTCHFFVANWGAQRVTSNVLSDELTNGTEFDIQFNGDGTWNKIV